MPRLIDGLLALLVATPSIVATLPPAIAGPSVASDDPAVTRHDGRVWLGDEPFSGVLLGAAADGTGTARTDYRAGVKHGSHRVWWPSGEAREQATYTDGLKDGDQRAWWANGQLKHAYTAEAGRVDGLYEEWHENGQPFERKQFVDGREQGLQLSWFPDGQLRYKYIFVGGRKYGLVGSRLCEPSVDVMNPDPSAR